MEEFSRSLMRKPKLLFQNLKVQELGLDQEILQRLMCMFLKETSRRWHPLMNLRIMQTKQGRQVVKEEPEEEAPLAMIFLMQQWIQVVRLVLQTLVVTVKLFQSKKWFLQIKAPSKRLKGKSIQWRAARLYKDGEN
jgi:hypothetical protein